MTYPSGAVLTLGDNSNLCAGCHQGRYAGNLVDLEAANDVVQTPDYVSFDFVNRHYLAAASILFGGEAAAAYQYPGQTYRGRNTYASHPATKKTCVGCHMRADGAGERLQDHRFRPQLEDCTSCHAGLTSFEELNNASSASVDYDGNRTVESFQREIDGLKGELLVRIQTYANTTLGNPIVYAATVYPHFFKDTAPFDGIADDTEAVFENRYRGFDLRLLRAAFNFHSNNDPCGDMHNFKYVLQTTYDAIDDLDDGLLNRSVQGFNSALAIRP